MPLVTPIEFFQLPRLRLAARENVFVSDATGVQPFLFCCFLRIGSTIYNQIKEAVLFPLLQPTLGQQEPFTPSLHFLRRFLEHFSERQTFLNSWAVFFFDKTVLVNECPCWILIRGITT